MITLAQLAYTMPNSKRAAEFVEPLNDAMEEFQIVTPLQVAAFLAQIAHESGELKWVKEIWGPTKAQTGYEGGADLGNVKPGDGELFKGRGLIQITGRANYARCGGGLGVDLLSDPALLERHPHSSRSAAWFWADRKLNNLADQEDFRGITRKINGGFNGYNERVKYYSRAKTALGV